jgi:putative transposase
MDNNLGIVCKLCQSSNTIKFGIQSGTQMYFCKDCGRKFKNDDSLFGHRVSSSDISSALMEYYSGMSVNDIRRRIKQEKGYEPAQSSIYQWIDKFTNKAVKYYSQFKPEVGDIWIADETVINVDGKDVWLWDIIDEQTRFLLASKMSYTRTTENAKTLFELAKNRAGKNPKVILTDKLQVYPDAMTQVFGANAVHIQSSPFMKQDSTRKIERWHETLKERTKVIYGLKDANSALAFVDGFLVFYNFMRENKGIDYKTPAEEAGIKYDVKDWVGVTRLDEPSQPFINGFNEPQYVMPQHLQEARQEIPGTPYLTGRRKRENSVRSLREKKRAEKTLQKAILAKPKRGRPKKVLTIHQRHKIGNRQKGYLKGVETIRTRTPQLSMGRVKRRTINE